MKSGKVQKGRDTLILVLSVGVFAAGAWFSRPNDRSLKGRVVGDLSIPVIANGDGRFPLKAAEGDTPTVTVVEFFASWCRNCQSTVPSLESCAPARNVRWISVSLDDSEAMAKQAASRWALRRPVGFDAEGQVTRAFGISTLPTTIVLSPDGRVAEKFSGTVSASDLKEAITAAAAF